MAGDGFDFTFDDRGAFARIAARLVNASAKTGAAAAGLVAHFGVILQGRTKANAAGRPGPNIQTGDYERGINLRTRFTVSSFSAIVGTNKPQGRRLEFGFQGQDALGRTYDQAPLPHFGPALDKTEPEFKKAIGVTASGIVEDAVDGKGVL